MSVHVWFDGHCYFTFSTTHSNQTLMSRYSVTGQPMLLIVCQFWQVSLHHFLHIIIVKWHRTLLKRFIRIVDITWVKTFHETDPKYHLLVNVSGTTVPFINTEMRLVDFQTWTIFYSTRMFLMSCWRKNPQEVENKLATPSRVEDRPSLEIYQSHLSVDKGNSGSRNVHK